MGNASSSSFENSNRGEWLACCVGDRGADDTKDYSLLSEDNSLNTSLSLDSSVLSTSSSASSKAGKSEESLLIEKQARAMTKLDKMLIKGDISIDDYAPKVSKLATIKEEALEMKRAKQTGSPSVPKTLSS